MKFIKNIIMISFIALHINFLAASAQQNEEKKQFKTKLQTKAGQVRQQIQQKQQNIQTKIAPAQAQFGNNDGQLKSLVNDLIKAVAEIKCSCGSKKDKNGNIIKDSLPRCQHNKEHQELVKAAYDAYEKLYDFMKEHGFAIDHQTNEEVLPSIEKLFECKNIQNKAWHPRVTGQSSAGKSQA